MAASKDDLLMEVGDPGTATTLAAPGYTVSDTSINVGSTTNWPTATGVTFAIDEAEVVDGEEVQVAGTYNEYVATVSTGTSLTNVEWVRGVGDRDYAAGALTRVYIPVSAERENRIVEWGTTEHNQDGTHDNTKVAMLAGAQTITGTKTFSATPVVPDGSWTAAKLDSSAIGHGFLEIKRATLSSAGDTLSVTSIPARTYLKVLIKGIATGGTLDTTFRVNNDSASNYTVRFAIQYGAGSTATAQTGIVLDASTIASGGTFHTVMDIQNLTAQEKLFSFVTTSNETLGTGNAPTVINGTAKWVNTSAQINRIDVINSGTGDFAIGSEIIVFGKD